MASGVLAVWWVPLALRHALGVLLSVLRHALGVPLSVGRLPWRSTGIPEAFHWHSSFASALTHSVAFGGVRTGRPGHSFFLLVVRVPVA